MENVASGLRACLAEWNQHYADAVKQRDLFREDRYDETDRYAVPLAELRALDLHCLDLLGKVFGPDSATLREWHVYEPSPDLAMDAHVRIAAAKVGILKLALRQVEGQAPAVTVVQDRVPTDYEPPLGEPRVFLCHASEDAAMVLKLYNDLRESGFRPWIDEKDLLGGQDWDYQIRKAIRDASAVLVCLSPNSGGRGYLQKEISRALDVAEEQPEDAIFIIPVKLQECEIPDRLRKWHWVELHAEDGYERLVTSLSAAASGTRL